MSSEFFGAGTPSPPSQVVNYPSSNAGMDPQYTRWIQEAATYLDSLEHQLRGEVLVRLPDGSIGYEQRYPPKMNDEGVRATIVFLQPLLSPNLYMSDIPKDRVFLNIQETVFDAMDMLYFHRRQYGIRSIDDMDEIHVLMANFIEYALLRAMDGGERNRITRMNPEQNGPDYPQQPQGGGLLNFLNWGTRR